MPPSSNGAADVVTVEDVIRFADQQHNVIFYTFAQHREFWLNRSPDAVRINLPSETHFTVKRPLIAAYLDHFNRRSRDAAQKTSIYPTHWRERSYMVRILCEVRDRLGIADRRERAEEKAKATMKTRLLRARVGQQRFRGDLLEAQTRCYVTGVEDARFLRASHIKAWRTSSDAERLDIHNGLLLTPVYDSLFDQHLISFRDDGRIMVSRKIPSKVIAALRIDARARGGPVSAKTKAYLAHHRQEFQRQEQV